MHTKTIRLFFTTVVVMIMNYIAFYLDDILLFYGWPETGLTVYGLRAIAFPVAWYVQVVEPYTLFSVPVIGRAFNYCIELVYFYLLIWVAYETGALWNKVINRCILRS